MNNTRFATAIHIMVLLEKYREQWLTSDWIAESININPAIVRKEIGVLKNAGMIESRLGKEGGVKLAKKGEDIFVSDIYVAVKNSELLGKKNHPNPQCSIGKVINKHLEKLYTQTDTLVYNYLGQQNLQQFSKQLK